MDLSHAPSLGSIERERLAALFDLQILDTAPERDFDELTRLAAVALNVESAAVVLIDATRQWFKARHGIPMSETPREISFCTHVVESCDALIVPDARLDPRFANNPLVLQDGGIRFYAGIPIIVRSGYCLGTLCAFDPRPRLGLTESQHKVMEDLARLTTNLLESRRFGTMGEIAAKVVDATSDAVLAARMDGTILYWNRAAEKLFGRTRDEALGKNIDIIVPSRLAAAFRAMLVDAAEGSGQEPTGSAIETIAVRADGIEFPATLLPSLWGHSSEQGYAAIIRDISVRKALEREREHARTFLDSVVANLPAMLFVKDVDTRAYLMVNHAGEKVIGRSASDMIGATDRELFPEYGEGYEQRDSDAIASSVSQVHESIFTRDDGEAVHLRTVRKLLDGPDRPNQYILGISEDVTQIRRKEAEVLHLAQHDALTGLFNRATFTDRLHHMVQDGKAFAMLSIDLDRFKAVNDQFGHPTGDAVLIQVGERLACLVEQGDWVARVGGDEFFVVVVEPSAGARAEAIAQGIVQSLGEPFSTDRGVAHLGASVGVVVAPDDGTTTEQLRESVDLALYRAKQDGRARVCFFNADMDAAARDRRKIAGDLRKAVTAGEISLAYQPLVSTQTGQITSVEALARWTHAMRGPIRPDVFVPIAEECGLIDTLGEQLLHQACRDALIWPEHIRVAVNLSPLQFLSGRLFETVSQALQASGLAPNRLQLEVTEGLVIRDVERTFRQLEELRALGIQILIDDFGVGYSSLSYFQRFPFDKVKIDKSFVDAVATSRAARAIIQAVVGLGRQLDMAVVAEGVETEEQMKILIELGCTHLQGYLFGRAVSAQALVKPLSVLTPLDASQSAISGQR